MQDEQVIETLASHTAQKAFTDGIRLRGVIRYFENLDSTRLRNPCEVHPKLAIVITDEILRSLSIGGGFPNLFCGPSARGASCRCGDPPVAPLSYFSFYFEEHDHPP